MRSFLTFISCLFLLNANSQYYFNDIISTQTGNDQFKQLRGGRVKKIKATSFEADNSLTEGFLLEEEISMDGKKATLNTTTSAGKTSATSRFYESQKLKRTQSYSNGIENRAEYTYDPRGQIQKVLLTTTDTAMKYVSIEAHEWHYDESGKPVSMLRIKNTVDTTLVELVKDEKGLVIEENWKKKGRRLETYYYYYDTANHLTDIVRYNTRLKKLIPDFQYEYDTKGRVSQMTQISLGSGNYFVWKYTYNDKGLKQSESGFDKDKKLVGRMEYTYEQF
jgi:antitoxin component YwqK of YwqJK toxin-antitoxin module